MSPGGWSVSGSGAISRCRYVPSWNRLRWASRMAWSLYHCPGRMRITRFTTSVLICCRRPAAESMKNIGSPKRARVPGTAVIDACATRLVSRSYADSASAR